MKKLHALYVVGCFISLIGCSTQNFDYVDSRNGPALVVKKPLNNKALDNNFVLPHIAKVAPQDITPPALLKTKLNRLGLGSSP